MFGKWKKILKKPDPAKEAELREQIDREGGLEMGDLPAMLLSAFLVLFLPFLLIVLVVLALMYFL